jgi:phosphate transport system substrate-binding protein
MTAIASGCLFTASCETREAHVRVVIRNAGSDTLVNAAQAWAEAYAQLKPMVSVEVAGGGSATGIVALIDGAADLANCSRRVEPEEVEAARRKTGREPKEWIAGYDALAVYVHRDNPLSEISLDQLAQVYGREGHILRWDQLNATMPGSRSQEIILIGRQSNSGTYQYFRRAILGTHQDFRLGTRDLSGSKEVVTLIGTALGAVGYSGMGYATGQVKMLRVSARPGGPAYAPTEANVAAGAYPITRPLYLYTLGLPTGVTKEYLEWILSPAGQQVLRNAGYVPAASGPGHGPAARVPGLQVKQP